MRTDQKLDKSLVDNRIWQRDPTTGAVDPQLDRMEIMGTDRLRHAWSGSERNRLFVNEAGEEFLDLSLVSGLDTPSDSRSFVVWDFDRDGWQDIALVNANWPLLSVYINQLGDGDQEANFIALRFVGGNRAASPSDGMACRDGYGAHVTVKLSDKTLVREHRCGEGFAAQNSATMLIGLGSATTANEITVRWPSGATQSLAGIGSGKLITVYEQPLDSPTGEAFLIESYRRSRGERPLSIARNATLFAPQALDSQTPTPQLRLFTSTATWCEACLRAHPELERLRQLFGDELVIYGVPVDEFDTPEALNTYAAQHKLAYRVLTEANAADRGAFQAIIRQRLRTDAIPTSLATDSKGEVLKAWPGVPTVSDIEMLLANAKQP